MTNNTKFNAIFNPILNPTPIEIQLHHFIWDTGRRHAALDWCSANINCNDWTWTYSYKYGDYYTIYFNDENDAMMFKLKFGI